MTNVGLERARAQRREVVLVRADIVVLGDGWLHACRNADAAIVGALLLSPALGIPLVADPETYPSAVPAGDANELAERLLALVDDVDLRARIGEDARRAVLAEHSMDAAAAGWIGALGAR